MYLIYYSYIPSQNRKYVIEQSENYCIQLCVILYLYFLMRTSEVVGKYICATHVKKLRAHTITHSPLCGLCFTFLFAHSMLHRTFL